MTAYPSKLVERAVEQLSSLPGIGRKSALRLALHLLGQPEGMTHSLADSLVAMRDGIIYCRECYNISDTEYRGLYHVLGGVISPIDGIGPEDLRIDELIARVASGEVREVILALGTTMEGDTTNFFIHRSLQGYEVQVSVIARGIAIGDEIEYADEVTLGRSILSRTDFDHSIRF